MQRFMRRRMRSLLFTCILLLGLVPLGVATAAQDSSRTEISFVSTPVEILVPGEETFGEDGVGRFRGEVARDEVTGDITGEAIITFNNDFIPGPNCDPEDLDNCFEGEFSGWGSVEITDENGTWDGDFVIAFAFFEGEEPFTLGKILLTGRGGNAGKVIMADITFPEDEEDDSAIFNGVMLTMGAPASGVNMNTQLCFNEETFEAAGAFTSTGAIESYGAATGEFFSTGGQWTHRYGLYGELTFTDEWGSMTIEFVGEAQDHPMSSVGFGRWIVVEGTGAYAETYGYGGITGSAGDYMQCDSGSGVHLQLLGDVHTN